METCPTCGLDPEDFACPDPCHRSELARTELSTIRTRNEESDVRILSAMKEITDMKLEREQLRARVEELEAGRSLTCAFCGAIYPPGTPPTQHERLTAHVKECEKRPLNQRIADLAAACFAKDEALALIAKKADEAFAYWDDDQDMKAGKYLKALALRSPGYLPDLDLALLRARGGA